MHVLSDIEGAKILRDILFKGILRPRHHDDDGRGSPSPSSKSSLTIAALAASSHGSFYSHAFSLSRQLKSQSARHIQ